MANRYRNTQTLKSQSGKRYLINSVYPDIPVTEDDIYVIVTAGDRYDVLADQFYGDQSLWWIIAAANNSKKDSFIPTLGTQIRIPADPGLVRDLFDSLNANR